MIGNVGQDSEEWGEPGVLEIIRSTLTGNPRVTGPWPKYLLLSPELIRDANPSILSVKDSFLLFEVDNGRAKYLKLREDDNGNWMCRLIDGVLTAMTSSPPIGGLSNDLRRMPGDN